MKKNLYVLLAIFIIAMFFTNKSENEFLNLIDHSSDPESRFYPERLFKNAKPIINIDKDYFSPVFLLDYYNLGLCSVASLEVGWMGTLRIDGKKLEEYTNKVQKKEYFIIFGNIIQVK